MFTGIIEATGLIEEIIIAEKNRTFILSSAISGELHIDQSVAHDGVCLTVESVDIQKKQYRVTAIDETLSKTNLAAKKVKDQINLERSMLSSGRIDGHFVQGHADCKGQVQSIESVEGSRLFVIAFDKMYEELVVPRGSIALNGISLTIARSEPKNHTVSVAIIPYTYQNTNIHRWKTGDDVNIEFDILGKYVQKIMQNRMQSNNFT